MEKDENSKQKILNSATKLFANKWFDTVSVREICKENLETAKTNLENGDYSKVYESLSGMKLNKSDETLYRQATLITYVTRQYESYQNYMEMDMKTEAINALVKGLARYDTYYNEANSLGVGNQMKEARAQIIQAFNDTFKISESEAVSLVAMSDNNFTQYYRKIEAYGKAR